MEPRYDRKETTGRRVKLLRNDLGLSQEELGRAVGVAKTTISGIERDAQGIGGVAQKLAAALGTTTDYLLMATGNPLPPEETATEDERDALRGAIMSEYERLEEVDRRALYEIAVTLRLAKERRGTYRVID